MSKYTIIPKPLFGLKGALKALLGLMAFHVFFPVSLSRFLHRMRGVKIEKSSDTVIAFHVLIDLIYPELIEIGAGAWLTQQCVLLAHVRTTPQICKVLGGDLIAPIKIGAGAYLGVGAMILPGVTVGDGAIVAARAVVTKDVPPFSVVAGNPARVIKKVVEIVS